MMSTVTATPGYLRTAICLFTIALFSLASTATAQPSPFGPPSRADVSGKPFIPTAAIGASGHSYAGLNYSLTHGEIGEVGPVIDLNKLPAGITPQNFAWYNGTLYFTANDPDVGSELFKLVGSEAVLVSDIYAGPGSSLPWELTVVGDELLFTAYTPTTGWEMYVYDGTAVTRLPEIGGGKANSVEGRLTVVGDVLYFIGIDGGRTFLMKYDGIGISRVRESGTNLSVSRVVDFMPFGDEILYFAANEGYTENNLYSIEAGIIKNLGTLYPYNGFLAAGRPAIWQGKLYFGGNNLAGSYGLYSYDGTAIQYIPLQYEGAAFKTVLDIEPAGDLLYIKGSTPELGNELFVWDGTTVSLVDDHEPGTFGSYPTNMTYIDGRLVFLAEHSMPGLASVHVVDGGVIKEWSEVQAGTSLVSAYQIYPAGETVFLAGYEEATGFQVWQIDGDVATRLSSGSEATLSSLASELTVLGDRMVLNAVMDGGDTDLYSYNGNTYEPVTDVDAGLAHQNAHGFTMLGEKMVFVVQGRTTAVGDKLFVYDGATSQQISALFIKSDPVTFGNSVYFAAGGGQSSVSSLYRYNGTNVEAVAAYTAAGLMGTTDLAVFQGKLYMDARVQAGNSEPYVFDGTSITMVDDVLPGANGSNPFGFQVVGDSLFFSATTAQGDRLHVFDGTDVAQVHDQMVVCNPECVASVNGKLYFVAQPSGQTPNVYELDPAGPTVKALTNYAAATIPGYPSHVTGFDGRVYFVADDAVSGRELFVYDGTQVNLTRDINPGNDGSFPDDLVEFRGRLFFSAYSLKNGTELYAIVGSNAVDREDPQPANELRLSQSYPNPASSRVTIQLTLPSASEVSIQLYDILGRKVATVVDGSLPAGINPVTIDVADLTAGTYFYRLETGGKVITRSLIIAR